MSQSIAQFPKRYTSGIYAIVNHVDGKRYIGSSWRIANRWKTHQCLLVNGKHHSKHLQHAWDKYGADNFEFEVLVLCARRDLLVYEQMCLDALHPEYNVCVTAGSKAGTPRSEETKRKLAIANIGKKASPEARRKMSAAGKGKKKGPFSEEHRQRIGDARRGKPHTEEARAKISAGLVGRKLTDEDKHKKSLAAMGNQRTLGLRHTEETKQKMSELRRAWWAEKKKGENGSTAAG